MQQSIIIIVVTILVIFSGFFSAIEISFSSLNLIRIKQIAKQKRKRTSKKAAKVYKISDKYDELLSTVVILNNVTNITITSLVTFLFTEIYKMGTSGIFYSTLIISVLLIAFGEIFPKNLAKSRPESMAIFSVNFISVFMFLFKPITKFFSKINNRMNLLKDDEVTATENELIEIVETIEKEGVLEQEESELIKSAIVFDSISIQSSMISKSKIISFKDSDSMEYIVDTILTHNFSRYPVLNESGKVIGIINEQEVFRNIAKKQNKNIAEIMEEPIYISYRRLLPYGLHQLQRARKHMAVVVDNLEEKNYLGIITLEDILEELVGEIYDEHDILPSNIVRYGRHTYEVNGKVKVDDLFDHLSEAQNPYTKAPNIDIWVRNLFGKRKIKVGEVVEYDNLKIKVLEMNKGILHNNKDKLLIKKIEVDEETKIDEEFL